MSFNDEMLFEKVKDMEPEGASEILISILLTSENWKRRASAIENLIKLEDNRHFQEIKSMYLNESHSQAKVKLIELLTKCYDSNMERLNLFQEQYYIETDWKVREKIIESIGKIDSQDSKAFLIDTLKDPNIECKKSAIKSLNGQVKALEPLIHLLKHRITEIYSDLFNVIVNIGKRADINLIVQYLNDDNINIRKTIPLILGQIGDNSITNILIERLDDKNPIIRKNAITALERLIDPVDLSYLLDKLEDPDLEVKKNAIKVLGNIGNKKSINPLLKLLKDKNKEIRTYAVKALDKILVESKNFQKIYRIFRKRNVIMRREAIKLLRGAKGDPRALKILIRLLNSTDSRIRRLAYSAILKLLDNKAPGEVLNTLSAKEWQIRKYGSKILGKLKDPKAIELLFPLLNDSKNAVRMAAMVALARFGTEEVIKKANELLNNEDWRVRRAAVKLLIKIGTERSILPLISCFKDEDIYVRSWSIKSLGKLENVKDIDRIISLLKDADPKIRISVARALAEIGDSNAIEPLIEALGDDDWNVRKEIEKALRKLDLDWMKYLE